MTANTQSDGNTERTLEHLHYYKERYEFAQQVANFSSADMQRDALLSAFSNLEAVWSKLSNEDKQTELSQAEGPWRDLIRYKLFEPTDLSELCYVIDVMIPGNEVERVEVKIGSLDAFLRAVMLFGKYDPAMCTVFHHTAALDLQSPYTMKLGDVGVELERPVPKASMSTPRDKDYVQKAQRYITTGKSSHLEKDRTIEAGAHLIFRKTNISPIVGRLAVRNLLRMPETAPSRSWFEIQDRL